MVKEAADETKHLWRRLLIKYFTSFYFGNKYSISETPSVSKERDKKFLMEKSVAYVYRVQQNADVVHSKCILLNSLIYVQCTENVKNT